MSSRWAAGERFGRYRIESLLGRGGMGEVYVAHDTQLGRRVALKALLGGGSDASLLREARAAAAIDHPNVAQVFDVDTVDGVPFLAMELVPGKPLRAYVGDASVTLETKVKWLVAIGRALEAAHRRGIVHRDVKPENVIVREDGAIKVLDFGIARVVPLVDRGAETRTGPGTPAPVVSGVGATHGTNVKGTLAYMAPEQVRGETIDAAADQWAWGIVAYELLSGELPWRARRDALAMVAEILSREPEAIAGVGAEVNAVVARAMAKRRGERFASVGVAVRALEGAGAIGVSEGGPRGRRWLRAVGVAVVALGALALVVLAAKHGRAPLGATRDAAPVAVAGVGPPDYGSQMSANPEAMAAYVKGVEGQNGASTDLTTIALFTRARKLDPNFAAAYLRALLRMEPIEDSYEWLAQLQRRREQLSAHDRALLDVIEPWFRVPADAREFRRRVDLLPWRGDADFSLQRCMFLFQLNVDAEALEACRNAARLRPELASAHLGVSVGLRRQGDLEAANSAFNECVTRFPSATRCINGLVQIQQLRGLCAEKVATLQRAVDIAPEESDVRRLYARAVLGRDMNEGRDTSVYRAAVDAYVERFTREGRSPSEIDAERNYYESVALVAEGRLADANGALERVLALYLPTELEVDISSIYMEQMRILVELDRRSDAVALARRWLHEREAWVPSAYADTRIFPLATLYRYGNLSRESFVDQRRKWTVQADERGSGFRPSIWVAAFGQAVVSKTEAQDALEAKSHYEPFPVPMSNTEIDAALGAALLRVGNPKDALPWLRGATGCDPMSGLLFFFQAFADLGDALAQDGDRAGACEAYDALLRRWGNTPGSVTALRARRQRILLHCETSRRLQDVGDTKPPAADPADAGGGGR